MQEMSFEEWDAEIRYQKGMDDYRDLMQARVKNADDEDDDDDEELNYKEEHEYRMAIEGYLWMLEHANNYIGAFPAIDDGCKRLYSETGRFRAKLHDEIAVWNELLEEAERREFKAERQLERARG